MKSKKLIFLTLVALSVMSTAVNAWRDDNGYHPVRRAGQEISEGTEEMGEGNVLGGAGRIVLSPATGILSGGSKSRRNRERGRVEMEEEEEIATEEAQPNY